MCIDALLTNPVILPRTGIYRYSSTLQKINATNIVSLIVASNPFASDGGSATCGLPKPISHKQLCNIDRPGDRRPSPTATQMAHSIMQPVITREKSYLSQKRHYSVVRRWFSFLGCYSLFHLERTSHPFGGVEFCSSRTMRWPPMRAGFYGQSWLLWPIRR